MGIGQRREQWAALHGGAGFSWAGVIPDGQTDKATLKKCSWSPKNMKSLNISVVIPCGPCFIPPPPCVHCHTDLNYTARWFLTPVSPASFSWRALFSSPPCRRWPCRALSLQRLGLCQGRSVALGVTRGGSLGEHHPVVLPGCLCVGVQDKLWWLLSPLSSKPCSNADCVWAAL